MKITALRYFLAPACKQRTRQCCQVYPTSPCRSNFRTSSLSHEIEGLGLIVHQYLSLRVFQSSSPARNMKRILMLVDNCHVWCVKGMDRFIFTVIRVPNYEYMKIETAIRFESQESRIMPNNISTRMDSNKLPVNSLFDYCISSYSTVIIGCSTN